MPSKTTTTRTPRKRTQPTVNKSQDQDQKYAPKTWGSGSGSEFEDLEVPSGQLCQVRRPGLEGLMKAGVLHSFDLLSQAVGKQVKRAKGQKVEPDEALMRSILSNPDKAAEFMHTVDRITCYVVVQPQVLMTPNDPTSRQPDKIYADMIDLEDKLFLMNYAVGGVRDLEQFRKQHEGAMGRLDDEQDAEGAAK